MRKWQSEFVVNTLNTKFTLRIIVWPACSISDETILPFPYVLFGYLVELGQYLRNSKTLKIFCLIFCRINARSHEHHFHIPMRTAHCVGTEQSEKMYCFKLNGLAQETIDGDGNEVISR